MNYRQLIPISLRLNYALVKRYLKDYFNGVQPVIAKDCFSDQHLPFAISVKQAIKKSSYFENKIHNLSIASKCINQRVIKSGEIFSFWQVIGNPQKKKGYKTGRNLINGKISEDFGGGLCQLSGLIYHLALITGLKIIERYSHSVDIYKESERFTPLGSDATVVYGYKDLRIMNTYPFDILFHIEVYDESLCGEIKSSSLISERIIEFEKRAEKDSVEVFTKWISHDKVEIINVSRYLIHISGQ